MLFRCWLVDANIITIMDKYWNFKHKPMLWFNIETMLFRCCVLTSSLCQSYTNADFFYLNLFWKNRFRHRLSARRYLCLNVEWNRVMICIWFLMVWWFSSDGLKVWRISSGGLMVTLMTVLIRAAESTNFKWLRLWAENVDSYSNSVSGLTRVIPS